MGKKIGNNGNKKLSLYPLKFEEAVKDLLKVKPEPKGKCAPDGQRKEATVKW